MGRLAARRIYYKFVATRRAENKAAIERGLNDAGDISFLGRVHAGFRRSDNEIRDIVGRHVLGNWLSDRTARSRMAAASRERAAAGKSRPMWPGLPEEHDRDTLSTRP